MKLRYLAAALVLLLTLSLALAAPRAPLNNSVEAWLPQNNEALEIYQQFRRDFGSDEVLLVQVESKTGKERLQLIQAITDSLNSLPIVASVVSASLVFEDECEVLSDALLGGFSEQNWKNVEKAFSGPLNRALKLFEPGTGPGRATIYAVLRPGPSSSREVIEATLKPYIEVKAGQRRVRVASFALVNLELDRATRSIEEQSMPVLVILCVSLVLLTTRSLRLTAALFIPVALGVFASEGLLGLAGGSNNLIVTIVKPMLFVLILASGLHIVVYFQLLLRSSSDSPEELAWQAVEAKRRPCLIAFATTALGFGSLAVADVSPIRVFGLLTASSLVFASLLVLILLPALLAVFASSESQGVKDSVLAGISLALVRWGSKHALCLSLLAALTLPLAAVSFQYLEVEAHAINYFPGEHPLRQDHDALEANGQGLASLELIIEAKRDLLANTKERRPFFQALDLFLRRAVAIDGVAGRLDPSLMLRESGFQSAQSDSIPANYFIDDTLKKLGLDKRGSVAHSGRRLRATLFIETLDANQIDTVKRKLQRHFVESFAGADLDLVITGSYDLLLKTQRSLLTTLQTSLLVTALLMEIILFIALGSWRLALISIVPNFLPVAGNFLLMVSTGMALDVGTTMTAAIALGIAVDDTIHFLSSWQQHGLESAAANTGKAIVLSSIIIGVGFASLLSSHFSPTRAFGLLCAHAMVLALIGDLVILPALLKLVRVEGAERK